MKIFIDPNRNKEEKKPLVRISMQSLDCVDELGETIMPLVHFYYWSKRQDRQKEAIENHGYSTDWGHWNEYGQFVAFKEDVN